jgi:hypothetical protein
VEIALAISIYYDIGFFRYMFEGGGMRLDTAAWLARRRTPAPRRLIGPVGTAARAILGLAAIAVPITVWGIGWWDVGAALIILPLVGAALTPVVVAVYERHVPDSLARRELSCFSPNCVTPALVIALGIGLSYVTPVDGTAIWTWLGASWLVAAVRGDNACETVSLTNAATGKRGDLACIFYAPLDAAEARRT